MNTITYKKITTAVGAILLLSILVSAFFAVRYMTHKIEQDEMRNLLLRAQTVATLIHTDEVLSLSVASTTMLTPDYFEVKKHLENVRSINTDTRFVYILKQIEGAQYFLVDAENSASPDFSPTGQEYTDATLLDKTNYLKNGAYTKGPYHDAWGHWFTAYAPILDERGNSIAIVGMDIEASKTLLRIQITRDATILIFSLIFLSVFVIILLARERFDTLSQK